MTQRLLITVPGVFAVPPRLSGCVRLTLLWCVSQIAQAECKGVKGKEDSCPDTQVSHGVGWSGHSLRALPSGHVMLFLALPVITYVLNKHANKQKNVFFPEDATQQPQSVTPCNL